MSTLTCVRTKHNPAQTYDEFKELRLLGFGASDIGSVLNEGDYSCKRRLFLERLGLFPEDDRLQHHVERGKFLEAPVAGLVAERTRREVKLCGTAYIREYPFMRANADRLVRPAIADHGGQTGVLEIKCPGEHMFRKIKKDGLPLAYILQLQWQMFCYGTSWGTFAIYWSDGHELLTFDVMRDDELIESLQSQVSLNWGILQGIMSKGFTDVDQALAWEPLPRALDAHSKACERCPMFEKCHGLTISENLVVYREELTPHAHDFLRVKAEIKALEKQEKELKELFRQSFKASECDTIAAGAFKIHLSERSREVISSKVKEVLDEKERVTYIRQSEYEVIDVKEVK